jgi:hypothetical protein
MTYFRHERTPTRVDGSAFVLAYEEPGVASASMTKKFSADVFLLLLIDRRNLAQARHRLRNHFNRKIDIVIRCLLTQAYPNAGSRSLMRQSHGKQHV